MAHRLSSCGERALERAGLVAPQYVGPYLVPRPGTEPASPALEGGFLTTGKSQRACFYNGDLLCKSINYILSDNYKIGLTKL